MSSEIGRERAAADLAAASLAAASLAAGRVQRRARWTGKYFAVFGLAFGLQTLAVGLLEPLALKMTVGLVPFFVLSIAMIVWAIGQRTVPRDRYRGMWGWWASSALYGASVIVGMVAVPGRPEFWVPAAAVVAVPLLVAGWRELQT